MIDTLIHQNADCIIISVSAETKSPEPLQTINLMNWEFLVLRMKLLQN